MKARSTLVAAALLCLAIGLPASTALAQQKAQISFKGPAENNKYTVSQNVDVGDAPNHIVQLFDAQVTAIGSRPTAPENVTHRDALPPAATSIADNSDFLAPGDKSSVTQSWPEPQDWNTLRIELRREPCFGDCPVYSVQIHGDGRVLYRGDGGVDDTQTTIIPREKVRELYQAFFRIDFFSLKEAYRAPVTDRDGSRTSISYDNIVKSVENYGGAAPKQLDELEALIDWTAGTQKWVRHSRDIREERQRQAAVRALKLRADQGDANAQYTLGTQYETGGWVAQSDTEAVRLFKLAADHGFAEAQYELGTMYGSGRGVAKSLTEAARLYRLAADQGHTEAQHSLGEMYEHGRGVAKSLTEAARLYRLAADRGDATAQYRLGTQYESGRGVAQSDTEAVRLFKLAADQGFAEAQYEVGLRYLNGRGTTRSNTEAARLFMLAAFQGHANAQNNLGQMYEIGRGVAQSLTEAVRFYKLAAEKGNDSAVQSLARLGAN